MTDDEKSRKMNSRPGDDKVNSENVERMNEEGRTSSPAGEEMSVLVPKQIMRSQELLFVPPADPRITDWKLMM